MPRIKPRYLPHHVGNMITEREKENDRGTFSIWENTSILKELTCSETPGGTIQIDGWKLQIEADFLSKG